MFSWLPTIAILNLTVQNCNPYRIRIDFLLFCIRRILFCCKIFQCWIQSFRIFYLSITLISFKKISYFWRFSGFLSIFRAYWFKWFLVSWIMTIFFIFWFNGWHHLTTMLMNNFVYPLIRNRRTCIIQFIAHFSLLRLKLLKILIIICDVINI